MESVKGQWICMSLRGVKVRRHRAINGVLGSKGSGELPSNRGFDRREVEHFSLDGAGRDDGVCGEKKVGLLSRFKGEGFHASGEDSMKMNRFGKREEDSLQIPGKVWPIGVLVDIHE